MIKNKRNFNISKCKTITFVRQHEFITKNYVMKNKILERIDEMKDLGTLVDAKLSFKNHINKTLTKVKKVLGFIIRNSEMFKKTEILKML